MSDLTPDAVVQELLSRGVSADDIAAVNPALGKKVSSGLIAPRIQAPDKVAERGAYIRDYGQINKDREELNRFYGQGQDLDRFDALNRATGTGGIENQDYQGLELANPLNWPGMVGHFFNKFDPNIQEMSSITSGLQGRARPVGSGSTSDFEQRLYRQGVPSPEKTGPVNGSITAYQRGVLNEQRDRLAFQEEFLRRNGSLSGSQDAWARYVGANPYTVTGSGGRSASNGQRADWRTYFGLQDAPRPAGKQPGWTSQLPKAQISAAMMFKGAKGAMGSPQNPYVPANEKEFDGLPRGSTYIDVDGKLKTKRN